MPRSTIARVGKFEFDVDRAIEMRKAGLRPDLRCMECGNPVRPHKKGTTDQAAHFEHLARNPECSLSTAPRK